MANVMVEEINLRIPPLALLEHLAGEAGLAYIQGVAGPGGRTFTVVGYAPRATFEIRRPSPAPGDARNALTALGDFVDGLPRPSQRNPFPFRDALIGYLAYDLRTAIEPVPARAADDVGIPLAVLAWYDPLLIHDGTSRRYYLASGNGPQVIAERRTHLFRRLATALGSRPSEADVHTAPTFHSNVTREEYRQAVARILKYIRAGDVYQVNFAQRLSARLSGNPLVLFTRLVRAHPMPLSTYFDAGSFQILSNSPELFLARRGRQIVTRPIKGTRGRGRTPDEDVRRRGELLRDPKERAEHVMIVDLERNDLGRVCRPGSVEVRNFATVETYPTLHHLVSTVHGELEDDVTSTDIVRATFPGGSITGAPKIRAMEIIDTLEPHSRGVYTGALGMIDAWGDMHFNLAIRTGIVASGTIYYGSGGGIVADSDPDAEYAESLLKAEALLGVLGARPERAA